MKGGEDKVLKKYSDEIERIPKGIIRLQGEDALYLYGNASYALEMLNRMRKYHVEIKGVLVSKKYYFEDLFEEYPVYEAEKYLESCNQPISIVVGFQPLVHTELLSNLCKNRNIDKIYVLEGCNYLYINQFEFPDTKICLVDNYYEGLIKRNLCREYYHENYDLFSQTYKWLEDEKSRKTMEAYLSGHIELTEFPMLAVWNKEDVVNQYFPKEIIHLSEQEVFVDCGAYTGDTLESFLSRVKNYRKYYALEPDNRRSAQLSELANSEKIEHISLAAWNKKERLFFSVDNDCGEIKNNEENGYYIEADAIDNMICKNEKVSFIKMDVEGAELNALYGARDTIKRDKPQLAICVYHKREDLITIPQYIKSIVPEYKFYLRAHFPYASEVVLYGICD